MSADFEAQIRDIRQKLQVEHRLKDGAQSMRSKITDRLAQAQCDDRIAEIQLRIDYLQNELQKLEIRKSRKSSSSGRAPSPSPGDGGSIDGGDGPGREVEVENEGVVKRSAQSNLELIKASTPINIQKVSYKLHLLEFKLDVERKVREGSEKLKQVFNMDPTTGDRKNRADIASELQESSEKMALLRTALQKYKGLYFGGEEDEESPQVMRQAPGLRRPITGKLQLQIFGATKVAHAPSHMFKYPESIVLVKLDGAIAARTRPSTNDRWNEGFEIHVAKASEIEITIYDREGERSLPIGMLWIKIQDIAEELRRQRVLRETGIGWVTAGQVGNVPAGVGGNYAPNLGTSSSGADFAGSGFPTPESGERIIVATNNSSGPSYSEGLEAWFDIEPYGQLFLRLNFVKEMNRTRVGDGLNRVNAVRRKEEIHEMNGHKFVEQQFYNIMRCAYCTEFLVQSGYQCEDCKYTCHKKCYTNVVTKCISKSISEMDPDMAKLKHRIPHRFEPLTNISANWCCHCGHMLPLGTRRAKRCSECGITCHSKCAHLVPDFCGMSPDKLNMLLAEMKRAEMRKAEGKKPEDVQKKRTEAPTGGQPQTHPPRPPNLHIQPYQPPASQPQTSQPLSSTQQQQAVVHPPLSPTHLPPNIPNRLHSLTYQETSLSSSSTLQESGPIKERPLPPSPSAQIPSHVRPPISAAPHMPAEGPPLQKKVCLDDFTFLSVLGKGNFGKVMLSEEKATKKLYAIKVLKKQFIIENDEVESTRSEKRVFQIANRERHPFLINLHSCFQTDSRIYFVMEYVSGGDLMLHIQREQFSEGRARFYACEVLLALEYFHKNGIVYRDLKLDNIMLALDGHIKIADYGLCKENMFPGNTTNTFCGTPEFMAPEILLEQRYTRAVDWWAFGVLLYQMLLGQSPFKGDSEDEIFDAILEDEVLYPLNMPRHAVHVCQRLLTKDPERRLGSGPTDAEEIKRHPFFGGVNWDDILQKKIRPTYIPKISSALDTSNFDEEFTREKPILTPIDYTLNHADQQEFLGFSYVASWVGASKMSPPVSQRLPLPRPPQIQPPRPHPPQAQPSLPPQSPQQTLRTNQTSPKSPQSQPSSQPPLPSAPFQSPQLGPISQPVSFHHHHQQQQQTFSAHSPQSQAQQQRPPPPIHSANIPGVSSSSPPSQFHASATGGGGGGSGSGSLNVSGGMNGMPSVARLPPQARYPQPGHPQQSPYPPYPSHPTSNRPPPVARPHPNPHPPGLRPGQVGPPTGTANPSAIGPGYGRPMPNPGYGRPPPGMIGLRMGPPPPQGSFPSGSGHMPPPPQGYGRGGYGAPPPVSAGSTAPPVHPGGPGGPGGRYVPQPGFYGRPPPGAPMPPLGHHPRPPPNR
ncbi:uncharacterized protein VTP21DRAFT_7183 [Calcarisporiella thermophila]|uniref:uncharacterized protein n=1 Tax=Calcarisporiella thermophila TaxID=911321 RepID=UPI0037425590